MKLSISQLCCLAKTFGLKGRGRSKKGFMADLVIFDEDRIIDKATFEQPFLKPEDRLCVC